ncbi:MAG: hypothetical protein GQ470_05975 [Gammaproteobacteria bacterium]|nr:hypothetical protein [Gammaproteobacteria bacterium]
MMQQINFYQPIFRKEQKIFSARTMLVGNLLVLLGLFILYGASYWQGFSLQEQLTQTIKQRDDSRNRQSQMKRAYPVKTRDPQLAKKINNLRNHIKFLKGISTTLASKRGGNEGGFSEYLAALSRQNISQLWLEQITIFNGGGGIRLRGLTTQSAQVPHYIQKLSHEPVFQGTSFHRLSISRHGLGEDKGEQLSDLIQFTLETALTSDMSSRGSTSKVDQNSPNMVNLMGLSQTPNEQSGPKMIALQDLITQQVINGGGQ